MAYMHSTQALCHARSRSMQMHITAMHDLSVRASF